MVIIEENHIHEHPLSLVAEDKGRLTCPSCGGYLDESYSCQSCGKKLPQGCFACDGGLSAGISLYICKQCWPSNKSPLFHKSCAELPQQLQIAYRPHCSFHLKEEYTSSLSVFSFMRNIPFDCDFCSQSHTGYRYCCYLCNFQIDARCAALVVKYHQSDVHLQHFSHRHPLVASPAAGVVEAKKCKMCWKDILYGEISYCCAPCEFYIHKSCGELLREIQHDEFHPRHRLTLVKYIKASERIWICDGCGFDIDQGEFIYRCGNCHFNLHLECILLKPNIKYEGHQHLLTLMKNSFSHYCQACCLEIEGTFSVRCVECKLDFHVQCGSDSASLPLVVEHKDHSHPLILIAEEYLMMIKSGYCCEVCKKETNRKHPFYVCFVCKYYTHPRCVITQVTLHERERLNHFSHDHSLFPVGKKTDDDGDIACYACNKIIQAHPSYGCDACRVYIHKCCAELPSRIQHRLHPHHLVLIESSNLIFLDDKCNACDKDLNGFIYSCESFCDFYLDLDCASEEPSTKRNAYFRDECKYHEVGENIEHYSHFHRLTLLEEVDLEMKCKLCYKNIHGPSYGCTPCMFYIHKSCAELPQKEHYPFHRHQCLKLRLIASSEEYRCDACSFYINGPGIFYSCDEHFCTFNLHLQCVSLKPNIKHEGHQHLLLLVENMSYKSQCQACLCKIEGTFFVRCIHCQLDFHVQCGLTTLPPTILHEKHGHDLILSADQQIFKDDLDLVSCDVCMEEINPKHPSYSCAKCEYYAHVRCVVTEIPKDEKKLRHFEHGHFLFPFENKRNDDILCNFCEKFIETDDLAYGCAQCSFYLHKSCAELPSQMQHLLHRHPLTATPRTQDSKRYRQCNACQRSSSNGLTYQCRECDFSLDADCFSLQLRVEFEGGNRDGEHILSFFEKLPHTSTCQKYRFSTHGASYQHCVKCNFNLHLLHSPLPQAIKIESHHHPLALKDSHVDDNYGKQICDVCEEERNLEEGVYCCAECDFIAEFSCVLAEVTVALREKSQDEKFRTINRKSRDKGLTTQDMIDSFTKEETDQLDALEHDIEKEEEEIRIMKEEIRMMKSSDSGNRESTDDHNLISSSLQKFPYSDKDFLQLVCKVPSQIKEIWNKTKFMASEDLDSEVVKVGDYKTIPKFAGVLKSLLDKYGDIGGSCTTFSQGTVSVLLVYFCAIVYSMSNTLFQDITNELIFSWWWNAIIFHRAGLRVDFLFDHLKRIMKALARQAGVDPEFYHLSLIRYHHEVMVKLSEEIKERTAKMDEFNWQQQYIISRIRQDTLRLDTEQLSTALECLRMHADTGLL